MLLSHQSSQAVKGKEFNGDNGSSPMPEERCLNFVKTTINSFHYVPLCLLCGFSIKPERAMHKNKQLKQGKQYFI